MALRPPVVNQKTKILRDGKGCAVMTDRRKMLTRLAAGAAAIPAVALGASAQRPHEHARAGESSCQSARPRGGPYADYFPNVVVHTHEGRRALFYNDLL